MVVTFRNKPMSVALAIEANKNRYIEHCILSFACIQYDLLENPSNGIGVAAYRHQVTASTLFRQESPVSPNT